MNDKTSSGEREQRKLHNRLLVGGFSALLAVAALIVVAAALLNSTAPKASTAASANPAVTVPRSLDVTVAGGVKKGPDAKMHDAYSVTDFKVKAGQPLTLRITNKDDAPHSITSADAGVNITVQPGTHTYTLVVNQAGTFHWMCVLPCDSDANGWAMTHDGYMAGTITAS
jgi:uncharacterized cupredoxin-like copper-binding protein